MKIYAAAAEALRKKERQDETQFPTKIGKIDSILMPNNSVFVPTKPTCWATMQGP
jgi:hypothetical protein